MSTALTRTAEHPYAAATMPWSSDRVECPIRILTRDSEAQELYSE
jgi:hypothetical protein